MLTKQFRCPYCEEAFPVFFWHCGPAPDGHEITCVSCHRHATLPYGVRLASVLGGTAVSLPLLWLVLELGDRMPDGSPFTKGSLATWVVVLLLALVFCAVSAAVAFGFGRLAPEASYAERELEGVDLSALGTNRQLATLASIIRGGNASLETYSSALSLVGGGLVVEGWPPRRSFVVVLAGNSTRLPNIKALREWFLYTAVPFAAARPNNSSKPTPLRGAA